MTKKKSPIYIMSDEEYAQMKIEEEGEKKESFLDSLMEASKSNHKFTTKGMKKKSEEKKLSLKDKNEDILMSSLSIPDRIDDTLSDEAWNSMMQQFDEISPIDDITGEERYGYRRRGGNEDRFDAMFKKEKSMLSDVLSELQKRSKIVNTKINSMTGKGAYGVSKNFVELVESSVSLDKAKLDTIKEMINIKAKAEDLRIKDKKMNPDISEENGVDAVADAFYKQIIAGNNKDFLQNTLSPYSNLAVAPLGGSVAYPSNSSSNTQEDDEFNDDIGFNVTQPIPNSYDYTNDGSLHVDDYGYIANESRGIEVCINRYDDGTLQFVAIDKDGVSVNDYQLPDSSLLNDIRIRPMAKFAYDKYERRYRIIDVSASAVSLDDLDDDRYDNLTNDDKYDIG